MALVLGFVLALVAVLLVLDPVLRPDRVETAAPVSLFSDSDDEEDPTLARRDRALAALKEIDFDRATGKLSDEDYETMKSRFTAEALDALKAVDAVAQSPSRPVETVVEDDLESKIAAARSSGSRRPAHGSRFCLDCGSSLDGSKKFCRNCGSAIGASAH